MPLNFFDFLIFNLISSLIVDKFNKLFRYQNRVYNQLMIAIGLFIEFLFDFV